MKKSKRLVGALGCAAGAMALLPAAGLATHSQSTNPTKDMVHGGGHTVPASPLEVNQFALNAESDGTTTKGILHYQDPGGPRFTADVECVRADGNRASIVAAFREEATRDQPERFVGVVVFVEDNGNDGDRQQNMRINQMQLDTYRSLGCPDPRTPVNPMYPGNLVVHDGV